MIDTTNTELLSVLSRAVQSNPQIKIKMERELYLKDFHAFATEAWKLIEPGTDYNHNWHIDYLTEEVFGLFRHILEDVFPETDWDAVQERNKTRRMCINVPTRSMKTVLISILIPVWLTLHKPTLKTFSVAYEESLAVMMNAKRRLIIESEWFQERFKDLVAIDPDHNQAGSIRFLSMGEMQAVSAIDVTEEVEVID